MTTPNDKPRDEPQQPPDGTPRPIQRDPRRNLPPPPRPVPVQSLDYARPGTARQPGRSGVLLAILGGMVSVVGSIVVGSLLANGGTGNSNAPIVVGLCFLGACLTVMIHYVGWPRALLGLTVGFLILLLIGCAGLGIFCGFIKF